MNKAFYISVFVFIISALSRLAFVSIPNFTPMVAMALVGGAFFNRKLGFLIPLLSMLLGDFVLALVLGGNYSSYLFGPSMAFVYFSLFCVYALGYFQRKKLQDASNSHFQTSLLASTLFFLISNFGAWLSIPFYDKTIFGLAQCYLAGLSFFEGNIFANFFLNLSLSTLIFYFALHRFCSVAFKKALIGEKQRNFTKS